jgi:pyridoxal phosphate enzyme (YggS family)
VIAARIAEIRERLARAAEGAGRDPASVTLVAVSKTHSADAVREAVGAGLTEFGENRVQEGEAKAQALADLRPRVHWHLIGHLQANKVRKALGFADVVHSVDSLALAERLDRIAGEMGRTVEALVQVDLAGEATKTGVPADEAEALVRDAGAMTYLRLAGLMLMPPYEEDPERARSYFRRLRTMRDDLVARGLLARGELSMGMSHDLDVAIQEGATIIRVGTAIFGERSYPTP